MFRNYFKTAWRGLRNNRVFSVLNILGLSTGMAVALLIGLWVAYQFSYDRWLPNHGRVYQAEYRSVSNGSIYTQTSVAYPLAEVIKKDVPGVEYVIRMDWGNYHGLVSGANKVYLPGVMAGADFLKAFEYPLLRGNADQVLTDKYSIVLTESTAKALFGNSDAMGRTVRIDNDHDLTVTGIAKDVPANTSINFQYIVPYDFFRESAGFGEHWGNNNMQTFIRLAPGVSYARVERLLRPLIRKYDPADYQTNKYEVFLHPMTDWHLFNAFVNGVASGGFIDTVRLFAIIGLLVLVIAGINFVNLSTARSEKRAREVGIRKVVGALRRQLMMQFLVESLVMTGLAFVLALLITQAALPFFNSLTGNPIGIPFGSGLFWLAMAGYVLLTGLLAGSRPAFYLSAFQPVKVLKGTAWFRTSSERGTTLWAKFMRAGRRAALPRKVLVTVQFAASVALIIATVTVYQQIEYAKSRGVGYDQQRLVMSDVSPDVQKNYAMLKAEMLRSGVVSAVTKSNTRVTSDGVYNDIDAWPGKMPGETLGMLTIAVSDADYFKTMGMGFASGRNFSGNRGADTLGVVLNEAAVKRMRLTDPLGQTIVWGTNQRLTVIGVAKNALMGSPFSPAIPTMFVYDPGWAWVMTYRIAPGVATEKAIATLTQLFNKYNPSFPYQYGFVDASYAGKFGLELLIGKLAGIFAGLAIFISCLGLFGLAAYVAEQRTKEIGVRKVLGASVLQVWMLLSADFILLVVIGAVVAAPVSLYFLQGWLRQYDYRITMSPWVFVGAGLAALGITVVTISFQAVRAAFMNPVNSLRSE